MEQYAGLSTNELRNLLQEERAKFAEKQKVLLEAKSKINRGKLSSVNSVTENSLNGFLQSCCKETEKEQAYVSNVIERVKVTSQVTKSNLEKVNQHAQELLKSVESDVVELDTSLQRVESGRVALSSILEQRESRGLALRQRKENVLQSSTHQVDRSIEVFKKIEARVDSEIRLLESTITERTELVKTLDVELLMLEKDTELSEFALKNYEEEMRSVNDQIQKTNAEFDHLETQRTSRNKAMECAESDHAKFETEVTELRDATMQLGILLSVKIKNIDANETQIGELSTSYDQLSAMLLTNEAEVQQLEQSLRDQQEAAKIAIDEVVRSLENEVECINAQLSADLIRADVMDNMFGVDSERTPDEWKASIEESKAIAISNKDISDCRNTLLSELNVVKSELEKVLEDSKTALGDHNMAQSRLRNLKKRIEEDHTSIEANIRMAESRITQATIELEELTNSKCTEAVAVDAFVTPARHSSLQNLRNASLAASARISDDSDTESVMKSVMDLPDGIVKRHAATQQCTTSTRSEVAKSKDPIGDAAANGGSSTETITNGLGNIDGDVTMEAIPLSASIDLQGDKVENWICDTPDDKSLGSGTTAEMMAERYPKNIFNETNALNETDITMDMDGDEFNLTFMDEPPPASTARTLSPPVAKQPSKSSIFVDEDDSDANASVWDDAF